MRKAIAGVLFTAMILGLILSGSALAATLDVPASYPTIQAAIDAASWGDTVLVAPGEYVQSISLKPGVTVQSAKGPEVTIIRGDGSLWWWSSWQTMTVLGTDGSTISGFTITGSFWGIANWSASPLITNNIITDNTCGIVNRQSSPVITNNIITGGGWASIGIYSYMESFPEIINNTITGFGNVGIYGDGNYSYFPTSTIAANNIVAFNRIGIINYSDLVITHNNLLNGEDIIGINALSDNIAVDPMFVNAPAGDYHLQENSPCIDAGTNDAPSLTVTDLDGNPRIADGNSDGISVIDIGAYEFPSKIPQTIEETSTAIQDLLSSGEIDSEGTATSLTSVLDSALTVQEQGNEQAADNILEGFIRQIEAQTRAGRMTQAAANLLIEAAQTQIGR